jgi:hypothetical protein
VQHWYRDAVLWYCLDAAQRRRTASITYQLYPPHKTISHTMPVWASPVRETPASHYPVGDLDVAESYGCPAPQISVRPSTLLGLAGPVVRSSILDRGILVGRRRLRLAKISSSCCGCTTARALRGKLSVLTYSHNSPRLLETAESSFFYRVLCPQCHHPTCIGAGVAHENLAWVWAGRDRTTGCTN